MCADNDPQYPAFNHLVRRRKIVREARRRSRFEAGGLVRKAAQLINVAITLLCKDSLCRSKWPRGLRSVRFFSDPNTGNVGSNQTQGVEVSVFLSIMFCVGRSCV
jgi:hypothetical protein